jgi:hypothetical protein
MKEIIGYLRNYLQEVDRKVLIATTLLVAVAIVCNYALHVESAIVALPSWSLRTTGFFLLFAFVFSSAWFIQFGLSGKNRPSSRLFVVLLLAGPAIFAAKVTFDQAAALITQYLQAPWDQYWYKVLAWPLKFLLVFIMVTIIWKWGRMPNPIAGVEATGFNAKPYFVLLACMVPLLAFAATRADFLQTYPKVQRLAFIDPYVTHPLPWKLLYELSYGIDFITIEFFFRGFLILAFARYAGKDAILPVAAFYCSIHFGKPLFECISSWFGGIILGAVVYNTRSIWGGLIIHLGIAWLMEVAGFLGHLYK